MIAVAKLTAKGQTTIPGAIRKRLKLAPGDRIAFTLEGERVTMRRIGPQDAAFLKLATEAFADWNAPEADEDFRDF